MFEKNVNFDLRMKIRKYLQYIWNEENLEGIEQQAHIINKLSDSLKDELLLEANGPIIRDIKLFNLNFSEETLRQTIGIMKEVRFTPGDVVFHQDEIQNKSIYIIKKGHVEILYENSDVHHVPKTIKKLGPGDIFGESAFFSNKERATCARSFDFTNIFTIKQEDFLDIITKNKKDIERFCQIRDNINIYEDYEDLYSKCYSCQEATHQVQNCPLLHYMPKREIILLKYLHTSPQCRNPKFIRKNRKRMGAFKFLTKIENDAFKFQEQIFPSHETDSENGISNTSIDNIGTKSVAVSSYGDPLIQSKGNTIIKSESIKSVNENGSKKSIYLSEIEEDHSNSSDDSSSNDSPINRKKKSYIRHGGRRKGIIRSKSGKTEDKTMKSFIKIDEDKKYELKKSEAKNKEFMNMNSDENGISIYINPLEIDKIKSFEFYFPDNNIENILARIEYLKLLKILEKTKKNKNKKKYQLFIENHLNLNDRQPNYLLGNSLQKGAPNVEKFLEEFEKEGKRNFSTEKSKKIQRKFFKKKSHIQKMMLDQEFDEEKFKEKFKKNFYQIKTKENFLEKVAKSFNFSKTNRLKIKKNIIAKGKKV